MSDALLFRQLADRQPEALAELYDRYAPTLLALARRILSNHQDAEEVLQEVFLHVWNRAALYDPSRSSVATWLVLLTRSRAIDRLRNRKVVDRTHEAAYAEDADAYTSPEGDRNVFLQERRERVRQELTKLPAEQREVLDLAFYGGLSQSEIASRTDIPLGTVKTRTLLAMKKLRNALRAEIRELL
ncbi:MAG TPA: sigma-70 family RNA polymerase sigma factor [Thermoanaerobaculia bacterium]|nr:sigma-70 family RNA polymerase sigma factor [Thermoanaerobaculia bacterium]